MTKRAWQALWVAMGISVLSASCGSDEATGDGNDSGTGGTGEAGSPPTDTGGDTASGGDPGGSLFGGSGGKGSGGSADKGGAGGSVAGGTSTGGKAGGTGTGGKSGGGATLGSDCVSTDNCAAPLECLTVEDSGIARGLCTTGCDPDVACPDDGICLPLADDGSGICLEACQVGAVGALDVKCHDRPEMTCSVLFLPDGDTCTSDADCTAPSLCDVEGNCRAPTDACYPQCGNDLECPDGQFCDPRSGGCIEEEPMGDPDATACDPEAAEETCLGRCATFVDENDEPVESVCVSDCKYLAPGQCGWSDTTEPAPAFCFPRFDGADEGDQGLCYQLCDCSEQCNGDRKCFEYPDPQFVELFGRLGVCFSDDGSETLETCP